MKIYQIYVMGGEYEDKFDYVVKTFAVRERAEEELIRLQSDPTELNIEYWICGERYKLYIEEVDVIE